MLTAFTRPPSSAIARCELTFLERKPIDLARALGQHAAYGRLLAACGARVVELPVLEAHPDACFVEDTAVVLEEVAVATRPGAASRQGETDSVAAALAAHRPVVRLAEPATLDGGDVLLQRRRLYVGRTPRTNDAGIEALRRAVAPHGYAVVPVPVTGCLHLKSAVTALDDETVLANPDWLELGPFRGVRVLEVPEAEPAAANVLRVAGAVALHAGHPRTGDLLARHGYDLRAVDVSEFLKAEAGVTCLSILVGEAHAA